MDDKVLTNEDKIMATYKEQLHKIVEDSSFPSDRAEDIKHDLQSVLTDGSPGGDLIGEAISNVIGTAISEFGIDRLVDMGIEGIKEFLTDVTLNAIRSEEFTSTLGEELGAKFTEREPPSFSNDNQEMGS